jgi:hypothetical protein
MLRMKKIPKGAGVEFLGPHLNMFVASSTVTWESGTMTMVG